METDIKTEEEHFYRQIIDAFVQKTFQTFHLKVEVIYNICFCFFVCFFYLNVLFCVLLFVCVEMLI